MNGLSTYLTDSATMLRRNLRHMRRYPMIFFVAGIPIVLLLLFVFVFGGTLGAGLGGALGAGLGSVAGGRAEYVAYVIPGILVLTIAGGAQGTAIAVAMDLTEGIVARFRTMSISRASFLSGHVLANVLQTMAAIVIVVVVALGMVTKSVEAASNLPMPLLLLPFFGSGFVPTASMPDPLRWFADNQPFTPIIETVRRLLLGGDATATGPLAVAWCVAITIVGYLWARRLYDRDPAR